MHTAQEHQLPQLLTGLSPEQPKKVLGVPLPPGPAWETRHCSTARANPAQPSSLTAVVSKINTLTGPKEAQGPCTQQSPNNPAESPLRLQRAPFVSEGLLLPHHELVQL